MTTSLLTKTQSPAAAPGVSRRDFLKVGAAATAGKFLGLGAAALAASSLVDVKISKAGDNPRDQLKELAGGNQQKAIEINSLKEAVNFAGIAEAAVHPAYTAPAYSRVVKELWLTFEEANKVKPDGKSVIDKEFLAKALAVNPSIALSILKGFINGVTSKDLVIKDKRLLGLKDVYSLIDKALQEQRSKSPQAFIEIEILPIVRNRMVNEAVTKQNDYTREQAEKDYDGNLKFIANTLLLNTVLPEKEANVASIKVK